MRKRKLLILCLVLVVIYALAGFFALPAALKPRLISGIEQSTGRSVHIGTVRTNPFTFSLTLDDFILLDRDSTPFVSFKELYVRYRVTSVFRHAWAFAQLHLDTPYVAIRVMRNGKLSISDLLESPPADSAHLADSARPAEPPRILEIDDLYIAGGRIFYQDLTPAEPLTKVIDSLDLALKDFTTAPREEGAYEFEAVTKQGEGLHWRGSISFAPLRSEGLIELANVRVRTLTDFMSSRLRFSAASGTFSARAGYSVRDSAGGPLFALRNGVLDVTGLVLTTPADSLPPVTLPSLHVGGISVDEPSGVVAIDEIGGQDGILRTAYLADGTVTLQDVLTPLPRPGDTSSSRMSVLIKKLSTRDFTFLFTDRTLTPEAPVSLTGINLQLSDLRYGVPGTGQFSASGILNGGGNIGASGTISLDPRRFDVDLSIAGSPLAALEPYVARHSRAQLVGGTFGLRGKFHYSAGRAASDMRYRGGVWSERARIADPVIQEDLIRWDRLDVRNVDYRTIPPSLKIAEIVATHPYARVIVGRDRTLNLQHLRIADSTVVPAGKDTASTKPAPPGPPDIMRSDSTVSRRETKDTTKSDTAGGRAVGVTTIGGIRVIDGSMNFADMTLSPNFTIGIQQLQGSVSELSSRQLARADVDLAGRVDGYAPVSIKGQINPLSDVAYTDIVMAFDGIELSTFTPYFSKFAGYKIERGKLTLNLRYKLNASHLDAENKIVLNQLTLGDKVESPDATSLPVKLAVALLKDSKGVIDLDIPISGSLDDPEFSVFPIVLKVLMNLLWKMVTAPFALLGSLFGGGGEDLQYVQFSPAVDSLAVDQDSRLESVARGLTGRPGLQLEVRGASSPVEDRNALAEAELISTIRPAGTGPLTKQDNKRLLEFYRERFKDDPEKLAGPEVRDERARDSIIVAGAHNRLIDSMQVSDIDLRALAQRRAAAIRNYLAGPGKIDPARIFLQEVDTGAKASDGKIRVTMTLTAP